MALLSLQAGKDIKPYIKYIVAAVFVIGLYWYVSKKIKAAKIAKGKRGVYDPEDIDPDFNFQALANRVNNVFVQPNFGSGSEMVKVADQIIGLNDSEFVFLYNTYNETLTPEKLYLGLYEINTMREAINYPTWLFSPQKTAINARFDRLNLQ
jgi:hypothetical protein